GELYFETRSSRIRPEPWQTTCSARAGLFGSLKIARQGLTQCVAYHMGGRPGQYSGHPSMSCWWLPRRNWIFPSTPRSYNSFTNRYRRLHTTVSIVLCVLPLARSVLQSWWSSSIEVPIGTVHATCLTTLRAARLCGASSGIGLLMCPASMSGSLSSSLTSV